MFRFKLVAVLLLPLVLSGCGIGGVNLSGNWTGTLFAAGSSLPVTMALTQNGSAVSGTVSLQGSPVAANGTLTGANLALTVGATPFSGTATATSINITGAIQTSTGSVQTTLNATKQ